MENIRSSGLEMLKGTKLGGAPSLFQLSPIASEMRHDAEPTLFMAQLMDFDVTNLCPSSYEGTRKAITTRNAGYDG
jgi:hypothetical protein